MLAAGDKRLRWAGVDLRSRWRRRAAVVLTYVGFAVLIALATDDRWAGHPRLAGLAMVVATTVWQTVSVFRGRGPVKSFEEPTEKVIVGGLDEWARYRYGVACFEDASEEQKAYLLRTYRVGNYLVPGKPWLDERERAERDSVSRWALGQVAFYLAIYAGIVIGSRSTLTPIEVGGYLWSFNLMARTLPQARVLWREDDPRKNEELRLMAGEA